MEKHTVWAKVHLKESHKHIPYYINIDGEITILEYINKGGKRSRKRALPSVLSYKGYKRFQSKGLITPSVARNLALCFIPNKNNNPEVNHIDGDKLNNCLTNLEWCTTKENINHAIDLGLRERCSVAGWNRKEI